MLNLLFSFTLLTCPSSFILNFINILTYILLTVLVFIKFYAYSGGIFQYGGIFNKMTFSNINLLNKALVILEFFFFIGSSIKHIQHPTPHHDINGCSRSHFVTTELINRFESLYTFHLHSQSVFLSVSQLKYCSSNSYYQLLLLLSVDISLNSGPFYNLQPLGHDE